MRQKSILLCHVLIIGVISTNSNPSHEAIVRKSENTLKRSGNGANGDKVGMKYKCPYIEENAANAQENETMIPSCHSENIGSATRRPSSYLPNGVRKESRSSVLIKKLTSSQVVYKADEERLQLHEHPTAGEAKEEEEGGDLQEEGGRDLKLQKGNHLV